MQPFRALKRACFPPATIARNIFARPAALAQPRTESSECVKGRGLFFTRHSFPLLRFLSAWEDG